MDLPKNITIDWADKHKDLEYSYEDFKDPEKIIQWQNCGFDLQRLKIGLHQLKNPYDWMKCVTEVINGLPIKNTAYCIHCMTPGNFLPTHSDLYGYYAQKNNIKNIQNIVRIIIFLDDSVPGQLLVIDDNCYTNYKKGDVAHWTGSTPHLTANLSEVNRYTLQITGTLVND